MDRNKRTYWSTGFSVLFIVRKEKKIVRKVSKAYVSHRNVLDFFFNESEHFSVNYRNSTTFAHLLNIASKQHAETEYFRTIKVEDICFLGGARHYMTSAFILKFKFKFINSHLIKYNTTTIRKKEEVKTGLTIHWIKHNKGKKVCSSQRSQAFESGYYHRAVKSGWRLYSSYKKLVIGLWLN